MRLYSLYKFVPIHERLILSHQFLVHESVTDQVGHPRVHLVDGVLAADVVPSSELRDIAVHVLGAHAVERAVVAALER